MTLRMLQIKPQNDKSIRTKWKKLGPGLGNGLATCSRPREYFRPIVLYNSIVRISKLLHYLKWLKKKKKSKTRS